MDPGLRFRPETKYFQLYLMRSCFGLLLALLILFAVIGTGAAIWHLSDTAEFARKDTPAAP